MASPLHASQAAPLIDSGPCDALFKWVSKIFMRNFPRHVADPDL